MSSVSIAEYGIDEHSKLITSYPLGNPDFPTGSGVEVRQSNDPGGPDSVSDFRFFVGVRRGDRWYFVIDFMDEADAARYAHAFHRGIRWTP